MRRQPTTRRTQIQAHSNSNSNFPLHKGAQIDLDERQTNDRRDDESFQVSKQRVSFRGITGNDRCDAHQWHKLELHFSRSALALALIFIICLVYPNVTLSKIQEDASSSRQVPTGSVLDSFNLTGPLEGLFGARNWPPLEDSLIASATSKGASLNRKSVSDETQVRSSSEDLKRKSSSSSRGRQQRTAVKAKSQRPAQTGATGPTGSGRRPRQLGSGSSSSSSSLAEQSCALILQRTYVQPVPLDLAGAQEGGVSLGSNSNSILGEASLERLEASGARLTLRATGEQERVCITFEHVNKALALAKRNRNFRSSSIPSSQLESVEPSVATISELGELNLETSRLLAEQFDLSPDEISEGLPMIDMSQSDFWPLCPRLVRPLSCDGGARFRSFTGHCNNLEEASWGAAGTSFARFLPPRHPDGLQAERTSALDGSRLPSPRLVSSWLHQDVDRASGDLSLLVVSWGQILDHDMALAAPPRDERGLDFNCCQRKHPNCKPIEIPANDKLYGRFGQRCMDFKRSLAGLRAGCALGPRAHINTITATLDGNTLYGSSRAQADRLRAFKGGLLKVQDHFRSGAKPLLPAQRHLPDLDCFGRLEGVARRHFRAAGGGQVEGQAEGEGPFCFLAGDERVNEQPTLTALHTVYLREHNRLAHALAALNPHWSDERLYQESRHIVAATIQHVAQHEYLPLLIGRPLMEALNLTAAPRGGHAPAAAAGRVSPAIAHAFSTAAFRQGHTFIQGRVRLVEPRSHAPLGSERLRDLFKRPFHFYLPARLDQVLAGIVNTPTQSYDPFITEEISGHLFQEPGAQFGLDLPAINLARGREQGVPGYAHYRKWCNVGQLSNFEDLTPLMSNASASMYSRLFKHVNDIDLWSGGVAERPMPGALVGPTFACIIARQFANIKQGDRFWFENPSLPSSFTLGQLREIRKVSLARLICQNSDDIISIQRWALRLAHPIYNPRQACDQLPEMNLELWREQS